MKITTDYFTALELYINNNQTHLIDEKIGVTMPLSEILMVSKFDFEVFMRFSDSNSSEQKTE